MSGIIDLPECYVISYNSAVEAARKEEMEQGNNRLLGGLKESGVHRYASSPSIKRGTSGHIIIDPSLPRQLSLFSSFKNLGLSSSLSPSSSSGHSPHSVLYSVVSNPIDINAQLLAAANVGDASYICQVLTCPNIDVNCRDATDLTTPLHKACAYGCLETVQTLLLANADVNALDGLSCTPLHYCATKGNVDIISALLSFDKSGVGIRDKYGYTVLHICVKNNHMNAVKVLIELGNANVNFKRFNGETAAHIACKHNNLPMLELLLEKGAKLAIADVSGDTPFFKCISQSHMELIDFMLTKNLASPKATDGNGLNILHRAAKNGNVELLLYMFSKYPAECQSMINERDRIMDCTPLHMCCMYTIDIYSEDDHHRIDRNVEQNYLDVAIFLANHGAHLDVVERIGRNTAVHFALNNSKFAIAKMLMRSGCSMTKRNKKGVSPKNICLELELDFELDSKCVIS